MDDRYLKNSRILKILSDPSRLKIIDMLSCGEKCGCVLLESFSFTQPTLSHHMKALIASGLVRCRKEGLWSHYSLNDDNCRFLLHDLKDVMTSTEDCICHTVSAQRICEKTSTSKEIPNEKNADL